MKRISHPYSSALAGLLLLPALVWASPRPVDFYVTDSPPLIMLDQGDRHGITGDIAFKAMQLAGYEPNLVSLPWPRAQRDVAAGQDLLITPLSRTQSREDSYTWIAPLLTMDRAFFSLDRKVESFDEAKSAFKLIAVGLGSAQEMRLREEGFPASQIYPLKIGDHPAQLLLRGRVDAWFNGVPETQYIWKHMTDKPLQMSRVMMTADIFLACSKVCDPKMVEGLKMAIESMRDDGTIDRIEKSYMKDLAVQ